MACLVTYVKFRVLGPSDQTVHYTLKKGAKFYTLKNDEVAIKFVPFDDDSRPLDWFNWLRSQKLT